PEVLTHLTVVPTLIVSSAGSNRNMAPADPGNSCICTTTSLGFAFEPAVAAAPGATEATLVGAGTAFFGMISLRSKVSAVSVLAVTVTSRVNSPKYSCQILTWYFPGGRSVIENFPLSSVKA